MKKCKNCGNNCMDEHQFCSECGGSVFVQNRKKNKGIVIAALLIAIVLMFSGIVTVFLVLNNPTNKMISCLEDGNGYEAANVYYENILGKDEAKAIDKYTEFLQDVQEDFEKEVITYEEACAKLEAASYVMLEETSYYTAYDYVNGLNTVREQLAMADKKFEEAKYETAIELYETVCHTTYGYEDEATKKLAECKIEYKKHILEEYENYKEENELLEAKNVLNASLDYLNEDAEITLLIQECEKAIYDQKVEDLIANIDSYVAEKDYESAIKYTDEAIEQLPEESKLQELRTTLLEDFEAFVIQESKGYAAAGDYETAYAKAKAGLNWFDSVEVEGIMEACLSHIPVKLGDMEAFQNQSKGGIYSTSTFEIDKYTVDSYNNTYSHSMYCGTGYVEYLVNYEYQTFEGVVACPKGIQADGYRTSATLTISGDGNVIAEFKGVTNETKPQKFNLDVSKYEKITLEWTCKGMNIWLDWGYFATIFDGVFTPIPKTIP